MRRIQLYIFILFAGILYAESLKIPSQHLSVEDGLPHIYAIDICQDSQGYIWFATMWGLARYNGYEFKTFRHDSTNPYSISGNNITAIVEDSEYNLWIGTVENGLNKYDRRTNRFRFFKHVKHDTATLSSNTIYRLFVDCFDNLWIIHENGYLDRLDIHTEKITRYRHNQQDAATLSHSNVLLYDIKSSTMPWWRMQSRYLRPILQDSAGRLWVGTRRGLNFYNRTNDTFIKASQKLNDTRLDTVVISSLFEDNQKRLWISTWGHGIYQYDFELDSLTHFFQKTSAQYRVPDNFCYQLYQDNNSGLWLCLKSGLSYFDPESKGFTYLENPDESNQPVDLQPFYSDDLGYIWATPRQIEDLSNRGLKIISGKNHKIQKIILDSGNRKPLEKIILTGFLKDSFGSLWFLEHGAGVSKINPLALFFKQISLDIFGKDEPQLIFLIQRSTVDSSKLWIGSWLGLSQYNVGQQKLSMAPENTMITKYIGKDIMVKAILEDKKKSLWIGTIWNGLFRLAANGQLTHYMPDPLDSTSVISECIWSLYQDRHGVIWVGTNSGLNRYDPEHDAFVHYTEHYYNFNPMKSYVNQFCEDEDNLWIAGNGGLYCYNRNQDKIECVLDTPNISCLYNDSKNRLWFAPDNVGLYLWDKQHRTVRAFYPDQDRNYKVKSIHEDKNGFLWCSTEGHGLLKFDPELKTLTFITKQHGLPSNTFGLNAAEMTDGRLFFPTPVDNIISFSPYDISLKNSPPKILLTDIRINGEMIPINQESILSQDISLTKEIHLDHSERDISIEMTVLYYTNPEGNRYQYWLENYDQDWRDNGTNRIATYTNLDPGDYVFHAKGANSNGVWSEEPVSLRIVIHPPWWATTWAYGFYIVLFAGIVITTWKMQLRRIKLRNDLKMREFESEQLKKVDHLKSQFFANISHEFRTPITLIKGPLEKLFTIVKDRTAQNELSIMRRNADRLQRLINQLLDISALEAGKLALNPSTHDIARLVRFFVQSFESQAKLKGVELTFTSDTKEIYASVDKSKMEDIVYNLVSNALKFTDKGGTVDVIVTKRLMETEQTNDWFEIHVSDSGMGIPPDRVDHIFDRFYQVDDSYVRRAEGSGIGLSLTKELVELHGGNIHVKSAPDVGSVFTVRLPVGQVDTREIKNETSEFSTMIEEFAPITDESTVSKSKGKPLVLIVEDNSDLCAYIKDVLRNGFQVKEALDGQAGFDLAKKLVPELVISDVMMPKMDGYQLCEKLKTDQLTSHIPVILLTARASKESKLEGLETGADDYLIKPFDADELTVRVKNLIQQRRTLREQFAKKLLVEPADIAMTSADEQFIHKALQIIEEHLDDPEFNAKIFSQKMLVSRTQLHLKLKGLTGQSTSEFIRSIRLKRAAQMINQKSGSISEIAYQVGFNHLSYFAECFKKQFGVNPREFK